jgi:hypothetical protein
VLLVGCGESQESKPLSEEDRALLAQQAGNTEQDDRAHRRPASESAMTEEQRKKHLQQLDDASAISDGVDSDDRHWRAGYAQAVTDVVGALNRYRKAA